MSNLQSMDALMAKRQNMSVAQRRASYTAKLPNHYPHKAERALEKAISNFFSQYAEKIILFMDTHKPGYSYTAKAFRGDAYDYEFEEYLKGLEFQVNIYGSTIPVLPTATVSTFSASSIIREIMKIVKTMNEKDLEDYFLKRLGKVLPYTDTWWEILLPKWRDLLSSRLSGTLVTYMEKVKSIVLEGIFNQVPYDKLVEQIKAVSLSLTTTRAKFLARDLTGTYNSLATEQIHKNILGTSYYVWGTALDERVRGRPDGLYPKALPSHWVMQSLVCNWNDPDVYSDDNGKTWKPKTSNMPKDHPGRPWACQCIAIPFDLDMIMEIDRQLELLRKAS